MRLQDQHLDVRHIAPEKWWERSRYEMLTPLEWKTYTVPVGFHTDMATIPRLLWPFFSQQGMHAKAAVIHDYLLDVYWRNDLLERDYCDLEFKHALKELGVPKWRVAIMVFFVRVYSVIAEIRSK
ncbi:DUF1353 domain-containing protein [bacterium]|nr:DUF1353 domain-containing protein [bacterium]